MKTTQTAQTPTAVGQSSSIKDYGAAASTSALSISAAWLRTDADLAQSHMRRLQEQTRTLDLDDRAYSKATATDVLALLACKETSMQESSCPGSEQSQKESRSPLILLDAAWPRDNERVQVAPIVERQGSLARERHHRVPH